MDKEIVLKRIQEQELILLKECIKLCEDNNIEYFSLGGTLLGAVRHQGFIPWDDDIDLGIPRKYYDKLIKLLSDNDEVVLEKNIINLNVLQYKKKENIQIGSESYSVYIDLFPLDGVPNGKIARKVFLTKFLLYRVLYKFSIVDKLNIVDRGFVGNLVVDLMKKSKINKILSSERIVEKLHKIAATYSFDDSEFVGNILGRYREKEIVSKKIFGNSKLLKFEDIEIRSPEDYDGYLKHIYGDYMKLPKEEDRIAHFEEMKSKE
jgi:putative licD-family phosphotransferase